MFNSSQVVTNKPTPSFIQPDALFVAQPTLSEHTRIVRMTASLKSVHW